MCIRDRLIPRADYRISSLNCGGGDFAVALSLIHIWLINRILVGEVEKVDGQKVQEVRIVYNFVGEITI